MTQQYIRKISIAVGTDAGAAEDFSQMKVKFYVQRGDLQTPNSADVRIYNLNPQTAQKISGAEFTQLVIQGGYEGNFGLLFRGQIKQTPRRGRESAKDSYVDITAADGDSAYNFSTTAISLKAEHTAPKDVVQTLIKGMGGIPAGYIPQLSSNALPRGQVYFGLTRDCLRKFARDNDCTWSIQDGQIVFIPQTAYRPGEIPLITPQTGLIGVPEQTQNGLQVRVLVNPAIKIGQCIKLDSEINKARLGLDLQSQRVNSYLVRSTLKTNTDGLYYVMRADHHGDTRANEYYTDLTCLSVDATQPMNTQIYGAINPEVASIKRF
jgi:hypothetical protein